MITLAHPKRMTAQTNEQIKGDAKDGKHHDQDYPGHLHGRRLVLVVNEQHQKSANQMLDDRNDLDVFDEEDIDQNEDTCKTIAKQANMSRLVPFFTSAFFSTVLLAIHYSQSRNVVLTTLA